MNSAWPPGTVWRDRFLKHVALKNSQLLLILLSLNAWTLQIAKKLLNQSWISLFNICFWFIIK